MALGSSSLRPRRSSCQPSNLYPPRSGSWLRATRPISCRRNTARTRASNSQAEWFYDVVVRTGLETDDAIDLVRTMAGHDDDRNIRMRTNFPQEIQPIILTEPQIQNYQAGTGPCKMNSILFDADFAGML